MPARQEGIVGGRVDQPPHVIEREAVGGAGVRHLRQMAVVVVSVIHRDGIRPEQLSEQGFLARRMIAVP